MAEGDVVVVIVSRAVRSPVCQCLGHRNDRAPPIGRYDPSYATHAVTLPSVNDRGLDRQVVRLALVAAAHHSHLASWNDWIIAFSPSSGATFGW
jgi:hypothetical protein